MAAVMTMEDDGGEKQWKTEAGPALAPIGESGPAVAPLGGGMGVPGSAAPQMTRPGTASGMMASHRPVVVAGCNLTYLCALPPVIPRLPS